MERKGKVICMKFISWYFNLYNDNITNHGFFEGVLIDIVVLGITIGIIVAIKVALSFDKEEKDTKKRGDEFEDDTAYAIKKYVQADTIRNILIPTGETAGNITGTTELDMAFITTKGIFCVECKSHIGSHNTTLCGSLTEKDWKTVGESCDNIRNPFTQNEGHIKALQRFLEKEGLRDNTFYNIVSINNIFSFSYFGKIYGEKESYYMIPNTNKVIITECFGNGFKKWSSELSSYPDVYTKEQVEQLTKCLTTLVGTKEDLKLHVEFLKAKHREM